MVLSPNEEFQQYNMLLILASSINHKPFFGNGHVQSYFARFGSAQTIVLNDLIKVLVRDREVVAVAAPTVLPTTPDGLLDIYLVEDTEPHPDDWLENGNRYRAVTEGNSHWREIESDPWKFLGKT